MARRNDSLTTLVLTALMTAIIWLCTMFIKIPVGPDCYVHLGDTIILLSVMMLPRKHALFASSVGATLADLMGGFAFWAPWTFCVKLLMAFIFGLCIDRANARESKNGKIPAMEIVGYVLAVIVGVIGYFVSEYMLFGNWVAAAACLLPNTLQIGVGSVLACILYKALAATQAREWFCYRR